MKFGPHIFSVVVAGLALQAGTALAANSTPEMKKMEKPVRAYSLMDLRAWSPHTFHDDILQTIQQLGAAHGPETDGVLLDAAELYLTHMLQFEARTTLEGIDPIRPEHIRRHKALTHAAKLLGGEPVDDFEASPLYDEERSDRGFWATLQAIATADERMLRRFFGRSFEGLSLQSPGVLREILPILTEAAIELDEQGYADAALGLLRDLPDTADGSLLYFLAGRAEEKRGNESSAVQAYFKAAEGWDMSAVRARLAIADMALADRGQGALLAAQTILMDGQEAWRGDHLEIEVLQKLALIQDHLGKTPDSLLTRGKLISRFPDTRAAKKARMQTGIHLNDVYKAGSEGEFPLAEWLELHMALRQYYRQKPSFAQHTETLADYMLSLGATDLAADAYLSATELLQEFGPDNDGEAQALTRVSHKLAQAQLRGGQPGQAKMTLEGIGAPMNSIHYDAIQHTKVAVLAALGDHDALIKTDLDAPSPAQIRHRTRALAAEEKWQEVKRVLHQFMADHPGSFYAKDAALLLIAANRTDDVKTRDKVVRMFPSLSQDPAITALVESLDDSVPTLQPLRAEDAMARLKKLEEAFMSIKKTGISSE